MEDFKRFIEKYRRILIKKTKQKTIPPKLKNNIKLKFTMTGMSKRLKIQPLQIIVKYGNWLNWRCRKRERMIVRSKEKRGK